MRALLAFALLAACSGRSSAPAAPPPAAAPAEQIAAGQGEGASCAPEVPEAPADAATCEALADRLAAARAGIAWPELVFGRWHLDLPRAREAVQPFDPSGSYQDQIVELRAGADAAPPAEATQLRGARYLIVAAERGARMEQLAALAAALPGTELRLAVRKPRAQLAALTAALPDTPAWVHALFAGCAPLDLSVAGPLLDRAAAGCPAAHELLRLLASSGSIDMDVVGPAAAEALRGCDCALRDARGFTALLLLIFAPLPDAGWIPLPAELPGSGTVEAWVAEQAAAG